MRLRNLHQPTIPEQQWGEKRCEYAEFVMEVGQAFYRWRPIIKQEAD